MNSLQLQPATEDDVPALVSIWFAAFRNDSVLTRLWPDTPGLRKWWEGANRHDMLNKRASQRYVKVVDVGAADSEGRPCTAAWAKWDLAMPDERGRRYPPWHEDMPASECDVFFGREEAERRRVMGDSRHFCA